MEQGAHADPLYKLAACSLLNQHKVPSLSWSNLTARSPCGQLAHKKVGLPVHYLFGVHLLYALVGSVTFPVDVAAILQAQFETCQPAPVALYFPQNEGKMPVEVVPPGWEELNSLSSSLDKELVKLNDCCLDSSNHIL